MPPVTTWLLPHPLSSSRMLETDIFLAGLLIPKMNVEKCHQQFWLVSGWGAWIKGNLKIWDSFSFQIHSLYKSLSHPFNLRQMFLSKWEAPVLTITLWDLVSFHKQQWKQFSCSLFLDHYLSIIDQWVDRKQNKYMILWLKWLFHWDMSKEEQYQKAGEMWRIDHNDNDSWKWSF